MSLTRIIVLACLVSSFFNLGVAAFAQASIRLWSNTDARELERIGPLVFPPALACVIAQLAMLWMRPPGMPPTILLVGAALQVAIWSVTADWWSSYTRLLRAHWLRVALCFAHAVVMVDLVL